MSQFASSRLNPFVVVLNLLILLLLILAFGVISARAQDASTGALRGTVSDTAGARIQGATVALVNAGTGLQYSATTNPEGEYVFQLLPPGDYSARADFAPMSPQLSPPLHIEVGGTSRLDFNLTIAGVRETITVSGAPQSIEAQPSAVTAWIEEKAIQGLPLNGRRFTDLALLAPGVTQDPRGLTSSSNGDLAFGGVRGYQSSYLVDGADNNNGFFSQARGRYRAPYQFSNEVVQEFRVSSNSYGAELGRAGGAVVNVITKTGSNHLHGTGFYFIRDSTLNARHPFVDVKPNDRQHQFGLTMGGPLKRNRAFFFAGFDQHIFHVPTIVRFLDGTSVLVPKKGAEPLHHGDYEETDQALVFAAASQLNSMAGQFGSSLLGNTGFFKVDLSLTPKHYLAARLSTSRYYGANNVFFDPSSPITTFAVSENGEEEVNTESALLSLTSSLSWRFTSHLRGQFSRDVQQSFSNSSIPRTRIYDVLDGFGRSSILPRKTSEHRIHLAETLSLENSRHSWKFGGDALLSRTYNFFPSLFGGQYIFDTLRVNPWTFTPMRYGMQITPLRAYAHQVPRYYIQNFGSAESNPHSSEYSGFAQDTIRLWSRLAFSLGVRYDLQRFNSDGLLSNPLWPDSGKLPSDTNNFAPRVGLAYSIGNVHPLVIRAGYGMFYTRVPQIFASAVATDNGFADTHLLLDNTDYIDHKIFPVYPNPLVRCPVNAQSCTTPPELGSRLSSEIAAFSHNFQTPKVEQASLNVERELVDRLAAGVSYLYVHGEGLIRTRDVNLPMPQQVTYPVYDDSGLNWIGMYDVDSFSTWQFTRSLVCPFPPASTP